MDNFDLAAINAFKNGHQDEFIKIYDKYFKRIYSFIYFKTSHKETAEDLSSQTFLKALKSLHKFKDDNNSSLFAWLIMIARNNVTDYYRSYKNLQDIDDFWDLSGDEDIIQDLEFKEKASYLRKYLKELKNSQREIIILRVFQDLSYKEIAEIQHKNEAACKMEFSRALKHLKDKLPIENFSLFLIVALNLAKLNK